MSQNGNQQPFINPYLAVVLAVVAASFASIFTKLADAPAIIIAFYRIGITVLILAPFMLRNTNVQTVRSLSLKAWGLALLAGLFLALHFATWITSLEYTSIASSTVLVTMQPLFVVAGGVYLLGERISRNALLGGALALAGSVLIGINDFQISGQAILGDILAFAGAMFVAGYVLIGRVLRAQMDVLPYTFIVYGASAVTLFLFALVFDTPFGPYPALSWLYFTALALVPTIFGHSVLNWALKYVKAAVVSISILGEPVGASILAYFIFGQVPTLLQVTAGVMIIGGLTCFLLCSRSEDRRQSLGRENAAERCCQQ